LTLLKVSGRQKPTDRRHQHPGMAMPIGRSTRANGRYFALQNDCAQAILGMSALPPCTGIRSPAQSRLTHALMLQSPPLQQHHQDTLAALPALARQVLEDTQRRLKEASVDLAMANDRRLVFLVQEALQDQARAFEQGLHSALKQAIGEAMQASAPTQDDKRRAAPRPPDTEQLSLVDEAQAEHEIELSRTVQLIDLKAEWEWNQLQAFTAKLQGVTMLSPQTHPCRPAVFAQALTQTCHQLSLPPEAIALLLRQSGHVLADLLRAFYAAVCERLKAQGVAPVSLKARGPSRAAQTRPAETPQSGALHELLQRLPEFAAQASGSPGAQTGHVDGQAIKLLTRLLDQMGSDPDVASGVQGLIRQLQAPLVRLALKEPQLMRTDRHPAWGLINELVSGATGHMPEAIGFAQTLVRQLVSQGSADQQAYEAALQQLQAFHRKQTQAQVDAHQASLRNLAQADQRAALRPLLRQQVETQTEGHRLAEPVRAFLLDAWVQVMAHVMSDPDHNEAETQAMLGTVEALLGSLARPASLSEREQLGKMLPGLIKRLNRGMDLIALPAAQREPVLNELMAVHTLHLRALPKPRPPAPTTAPSPAPGELSPQELVRQMREEVIPPLGSDGYSDTQGMDTNLGNLATIPMAYDALPDSANRPEPDPATCWIDHLNEGSWCKLHLKGEWISARLLWQSGEGDVWLFAGRHTGSLHALSRRALLRLRNEGLATTVQEGGALQRAVDSLLGDLA
jgi:hypothetical protein